MDEIEKNFEGIVWKCAENSAKETMSWLSGPIRHGVRTNGMPATEFAVFFDTGMPKSVGGRQSAESRKRGMLRP
jgi:hypothetical protein